MEEGSTHVMVLEVLQRASSQNPDILKPAEEKLKEWETQPGFYLTLFNVISNNNLDINIRWIAVLYMKNGIDKYWRKTAPGAINEVEKMNIKQGLLRNFNEPVSQIALQRAVIMSKIARQEFPKEWPELFPALVQAIESSDGLVQHRGLLTFHHVIKAIASKRLAVDRRNFNDLTVTIFNFVVNLWNNFTDNFINGIIQGADIQMCTEQLEKALLCLRVLRKLSVFGFHKPHESRECMDFMNVIFDKIRTMLQCRKQLKPKDSYILELTEKFIVHMTKVLLSMLVTNSSSFLDLINPTLELCVFYLFTNEGITYLFERFVIHCFNLIKNILTMRTQKSKQDIFQPQMLVDIGRKLITHYLVLTQDELAAWDSDPETFSNDETGDSWKYSLRPSMETVFVTIFHEYKTVLTPLLLELIAETNVLVSPDDMQGILKKDAVYNAVGLCAFHLYDEVDFDTWFSNTLLKELQIKHNNYRVIRRRVTALVGQWLGIKMSPQLRPVLYECTLNLLSADEDMAVRLTAASTLRFAIDDFEFNGEQFKNYMFSAFSLLFNLLKDARECETKMQVLNVLTLMLERMGTTEVPNAESLIEYLPHLWQESEDHNMLRCAIVATLVQLIKSVSGATSMLNPFLIPIIQLGTDTNQNAIVYLLEDTLDLWLTVVEYSTTMTNELLQLFHNMIPLLDYSTENLRQCLLICLVYLLLSPELVMRSFGTQIITVCDSLLPDLKNEGIVMLMRLVETFVRVLPVLGAETVLPILPRVFQNIYKNEEYPMVMSMYLATLCRILLSSHEVFTRVLNTLAQMHNESEQITLGKILDSWLKNMPNVSQIEVRKLLGLGLTNLLTTKSMPVIDRFGLVMINILEALNDITKTEETGEMVDSLVLTEGQSPSHFDEESDCCFESDHDQRKKQLILSDPVHNIVLKEYLQSQIHELRSQIGLEQFKILWETVDNDTVMQLSEYISL